MNFSYRYSSTKTEDFYNEPLADFTIPETRRSLVSELEKFEKMRNNSEFIPAPIIQGKEIYTNSRWTRVDCNDTFKELYEAYFADNSCVESAFLSFKSDKKAWNYSSWSDRIQMLQNLKELIRRDSCELTAVIIREVGKPWKDADAEVAEAIDFCKFYALEAKACSDTTVINLPGELNTIQYTPRGIAAVISPWNFPLAILTGMTVASLVTGNYTLIKPAEQSTLIGFIFAKLLLEAGFPKNSFAFLPGEGETIGRDIINRREVSTIAFTGSKLVGTEIINTVNKLNSEDIHFKRIIAELGSKNPVIVDTDADLDSTIPEIVSSAFSFAGQKCSACSRLIVVGDNIDSFIDRFSKTIDMLSIGRTEISYTNMGPLVDLESLERVNRYYHKYIDDKLKVIYSYSNKRVEDLNGNFFLPVVFSNIPDNHDILENELFAPLLSLLKASSFENAIEIANNSKTSLTASVYSRNPDHIHKAKQELDIGNLYINRSCTGALVARHPFGGRKLSGTGFKAGGEDYIKQFLNQTVCTENTIRKGYTPEL